MKRILLILVVLVLAFPVRAQDVSAKTELRRHLEEEIQFIDSQLQKLSSKLKVSDAKLSLIRRKVNDRKAIVSQLDSQISGIEADIELKNRHITALKKRLDNLESHYRQLVYDTYKNRDTRFWFMYVLSSQDIGQGYRRMVYLKHLSSAINDEGRKIKEFRKQLESELRQLEEKKIALAASRREREDELVKLKSEESQSKKAANDISRNKSRYQKELKAKRAQLKKLDREIQNILKKSETERMKNRNEADIKLSAKFGQNRGLLPWPVSRGVITGHFGSNSNSEYKSINMLDNSGVDITSEAGAGVLCVFDGVVNSIVVMPGYGKCVLIQHGQYYTLYCKLKDVSVKRGQKVSTGTLLGTLAVEDGLSQIHFQVWDGTIKQNPEQWLRP